MKNPAVLIPDAMKALLALNASIEGKLPKKTLELCHLRVSQMNGCAVCLDMSKHSTETPERLITVSAWRDAPYFTDAERAALALAEAITDLPVPDDVWNEARKHFGEPELAALVLHATLTNVWNRLNVATRAVPGEKTW
ncbi:MAG TPA: carboxymuconolactone decarboxylase family protein [Polyangiaceae bacterium]|jgi:AhpD family alkylhydroperoxidase